jgi:serine/threonine protein kinase
MEYCALGALTDVLKLTGRKTLTEREIAAVTKEVLGGLVYLHSNNKMHRDIKASYCYFT